MTGELVYEPTWAMKPAEEKRAFEKFIEEGDGASPAVSGHAHLSLRRL